MKDDPEAEWSYLPAGDEQVPARKRPVSELREVGLVDALGHWFCRRMVAVWLKLAHPVMVRGRENLPSQTPFVLVANHTSHLDALVLGSLFPDRFLGRVFSLAAGDFFFNSSARSIVAAQLVNALPVWRGKPSAHALQHLRDRLLQGGCGFIVFPEGTRSRDGEMKPFKPGIGMLVAESNIPVIPCLLRGCHEAWPADARLPRRGRIEVIICPPHTFPTQPNRREGWTAIARELEETVREHARLFSDSGN